MVVFIFFFMLFSSISLQHIEAVDTNCPPTKCSPNGPDIIFPFSLQGLHPNNCSYPGFKLLCKENKTRIPFPSYGDLVVKSISYDTKRLSLLDPKNCVHEVFLNLNLSQTPFQYYYVVKNYTYLNCSVVLSPPFVQVPCLSGLNYHVYVVESFQVVPAHCKPVKTVAIPFSYSPYLSDNSFGLGFTWALPGDSEVKGGCCESWFARCFSGAHRKVINIVIFIVMVATLIVAKTYCSKNAWVEKLFRYCETLKHAYYGGAKVKQVRNQIKSSLAYENYGSGEVKGMLSNETCT